MISTQKMVLLLIIEKEDVPDTIDLWPIIEKIRQERTPEQKLIAQEVKNVEQETT